jgi:anti-anti-sigma regulatory factor
MNFFNRGNHSFLLVDSDDLGNAASFRSRLTELVPAIRGTSVIIKLSEVNEVSLMALSGLASLGNQLRAAGKDIRIEATPVLLGRLNAIGMQEIFSMETSGTGELASV